MVVEKTRALIVDDDPFMRELLTAILEGEGYAVDSAEDGAKAFSAFCADPGIGLVISDMNMPDMNGLELIKQIRGRGSDVPAIILTGDAEMPYIMDALNDGACEILIKDENLQDTLGFFVTSVMKKYKQREQKTHQGAALKSDGSG